MNKTGTIILFFLAISINCSSCSTTAENQFSMKGENKMTTNANLQKALSRCESAEENQILGLVTELKNLDYLYSLDEKSTYELAKSPHHLLELLTCIARKISTPVSANAFAELSSSPNYSAHDNEGSLRRYALVVSTGFIKNPGPELLSFLEKEIISPDAENLSPAVMSLARIGTTEAANMLHRLIFDPQTSVIPESISAISLSNYIVTLGENRDKLPVLSLLTDVVYKSDMYETVVQCIVEDVIKRGKDPHKHVHLAPLNQNTPDGILLAGKLALWIIANGSDLKEYEDFTAITKRLPDLLGIKPTEPTSGEPAETKRWAIEQFERALKVEPDQARKKQIQDVLSQLRT